MVLSLQFANCPSWLKVKHQILSFWCVILYSELSQNGLFIVQFLEKFEKLLSYHDTVQCRWQNGNIMFIWQNGLVSGAPYLLMWAVIVASGAVADMLQKKHILSTTNVRKLANSLGKSTRYTAGFTNCHLYIVFFSATCKSQTRVNCPV